MFSWFYPQVFWTYQFTTTGSGVYVWTLVSSFGTQTFNASSDGFSSTFLVSAFLFFLQEDFFDFYAYFFQTFGVYIFSEDLGLLAYFGFGASGCFGAYGFDCFYGFFASSFAFLSTFTSTFFYSFGLADRLSLFLFAAFYSFTSFLIFFGADTYLGEGFLDFDQDSFFLAGTDLTYYFFDLVYSTFFLLSLPLFFQLSFQILLDLSLDYCFLDDGLGLSTLLVFFSCYLELAVFYFLSFFGGYFYSFLLDLGQLAFIFFLSLGLFCLI